MSQDFSVLLHTPTDGTDGDCTASLKNPRGIEPRRILPQPRGSQAHTCMSPQSSDCLTFIHNLKPSDPSIFFRTPHPNNPCKGATTRKCAEIDNQIISVGNGSSMVITTVKDGDGVVKSVSRNVVAASASDIIQEEILNLPANAEMTHVRQ